MRFRGIVEVVGMCRLVCRLDAHARTHAKLAHTATKGVADRSAHGNTQYGTCLWYAGCRHARLVVEDATKVVAVWEHVSLEGGRGVGYRTAANQQMQQLKALVRVGAGGASWTRWRRSNRNTASQHARANTHTCPPRVVGLLLPVSSHCQNAWQHAIPTLAHLAR